MSVHSESGPGSVVQFPDTPLVKEARVMLEHAAPQQLVAHSLRCFLLGRAYGRKQGMEFDEEGLLLAALFHDLGLCAETRNTKVPFPMVGSRALRDFLTERGVSAERIGPLTEAIELHMQMLPKWQKGPTVGLLQVGAWMDVTGLRQWSVSREAREITEAYPRGALRLTFYATLMRSFGSVGSCVGLLFPESYRG